MRTRLLALPALVCGALLVFAAAPAAGAATAPLPRVVETFSALPGGTSALALSPDGQTLYTVQAGGNDLWMLDTDTLAVSNSSCSTCAPLTFDPTSVTTSPDGSTVYIGNHIGDRYFFNQTAADGTDPRFTELAPGRLLHSIVATTDPDFVVSTGGDELLRFDLGGNTVSPITFEQPFSTTPTSVDAAAALPGGGVVVTGSSDAGTSLYVFGAGPAFEPLAELQLSTDSSADASAVAVTTSGSQAIVTAQAEQKAYVVDLTGAAPTLLGAFSTSAAPVAAAYSPADPDTAYVGTVGGGVDVVDPASLSLLGTVRVGTGDVQGLAVASSGDVVYAAGNAPGDKPVMLSASTITTSAALTTVDVDQPVNAVFATAGFDLSVSYAISPALPDDLTLDPATGVVSGTPTEVLPATTYTVSAESADGNDASTAWQLEVDPAAATVTPTPPAGSGAVAVTTPPATTAPAALASTGVSAVGPLVAAGGILLAGAIALAVSLQVRSRARHTRRD
ncbi:putative Ig domain-containing protein [Subtercola sp. YIM 133946]|uniref:putative Ig domain-containing protein n=1 Tax=Subtercola sp. YIM 133946 TaxID=3118909 RepID=UPI002F932590